MKEQIIITFDREKYKEEFGIELPSTEVMMMVLNPTKVNSDAFKLEIKTLED